MVGTAHCGNNGRPLAPSMRRGRAFTVLIGKLFAQSCFFVDADLDIAANTQTKTELVDVLLHAMRNYLE